VPIATQLWSTWTSHSTTSALGLKEGSQQFGPRLRVGNVLKHTETRLTAIARFALDELVGGINRGIEKHPITVNREGHTNAFEPHDPRSSLSGSRDADVTAAAASSFDDPNKAAKECEVVSQAPSTSPKLLLTIPEAASALSISRSKMYELLNSEAIPSLYIGRSRRIGIRDLEEFVFETREFTRSF
jgi:excisionase family DNA binding protein